MIIALESHKQEINAACERYNLKLETWRRQERAFGLLKKVYAKRAKIRGEQPIITTPASASEQASDADDRASRGGGELQTRPP